MRFGSYLTIAALGVAGSLVAWTRAAPTSAPSGSAPAASVSTGGKPATAAGTKPAAPASGIPPAAAPRVALLQRDIERLIESPGWSGDSWTVMVVSMDKGDTLFAHDPGALLAPASNMKVFTTSAGLYYLGPDFRYNTFLLGTGPIENGVLKGDLVLYGTGDPTFSSRFGKASATLDAFADTLVALGVKSISGSLVGDGSYFSGSGTGQGWKTEYVNASYAAPAGALQYGEGLATVSIKPGAIGSPAEVDVAGAPNGQEITNETRTVRAGRTTISVTRIGYEGGLLVRGQIAARAGTQMRTFPVSDPARYTAAVFNSALQRRGITVTGGMRAAHTAAESPVTGRSVFAPALDAQDPVRVLAIHNSPPLLTILSIINHKSHNLMAEHTMRTVGRVASGEGSAAAGSRAVMHMLEESAPGTSTDLQIYDGSGLSPLNRVNARAMIHVLSFMAHSPLYANFFETLPEAGARDGLHRMYKTGAEGNLRAKTGTIDNVSSLSGYVRAKDGEKLAFSIISNGVPSTWKAKRIEDAIGARLSAFTRNEGDVAAPIDPITDTIVPKSKAATALGNRTKKPTTTAKKTSGRTYTIKSGDTLEGIAKRNGTTIAKLRAVNPGMKATRLMPGKKIKLP